jgi:hypothetical protein
MGANTKAGLDQAAIAISVKEPAATRKKGQLTLAFKVVR